MLANPNIRVKSDQDTVWQEIKSQDNYKLKLGVNPTDMFLTFNDYDILTYDTSKELSFIADQYSITDSSGNSLLSYNGTYTDLNGTVRLTSTNYPGFYFYDSAAESYPVFIYYHSPHLTLKNNNTYGSIFLSAKNAVNLSSEDNVILNTDNEKLYLNGLPSDDTGSDTASDGSFTLDHVLVIDDGDVGKVYKRSIASLSSSINESKLVKKVTITYEDDGNPISLLTVADGYVLWHIVLNVVTEFNDSGTDYLAIDDSEGGADWAETSIDLSSAGYDATTFDEPIEFFTGAEEISAQYTGQNGDSTQGQVDVYVIYSIHS